MLTRRHGIIAHSRDILCRFLWKMLESSRSELVALVISHTSGGCPCSVRHMDDRTKGPSPLAREHTTRDVHALNEWKLVFSGLPLNSVQQSYSRNYYLLMCQAVNVRFQAALRAKRDPDVCRFPLATTWGLMHVRGEPKINKHSLVYRPMDKLKALHKR